MTPWTVARQAPLSLGILQARMLEWVAISFSRESSQARDGTQVSHIAGGFFTIRAPREAHVTTISIVLEKISKISLLELQNPQKLKYEVG